MTDELPGLELEDVGYRYPRAARAAVAGVDLVVERGEVVAVVGPSGSGKSTLLRLVTGLLAPTTGAVRIAGDDAADVAPERRPVAMVFQGLALFPHLTVAENIGFGLRVRGASAAERRTRVDRAAAALGLDGLLHRLPAQLSGGERQRTALARAMVRDPVVFCLDEPLSSLDPVLRTAARRELHEVLRSDGRCGLYVTHDQAEAMTAGDRVAVLRDGAVEQVAPARDLYERPATTFVASFVGSPPMSLLSADAAAGVLRPPFEPPPGATLGVRAEHVRLDAGADPLPVRAVEDLGSELHVVLGVSGQQLVARAPAGLRVRPGDRMGVRVAPADVHVFDAAGRSVTLGVAR